MKKSTKYIVICITILIIAKKLHLNGIHSEFRVVEPIINLLIYLFFVFSPFLVILPIIKTKDSKNKLLDFAIPIFLIGSPIIILFFSILVIDICYGKPSISKIFEQKLSNNNYFCVYLTPDYGAWDTGVSQEVYSIDNKLPLGIVKSNFLLPNEYKIYHDEKNDTETIKIDNNSIFIDRKSFKGY